MTRYSILTAGLVFWIVSAFGLGWAVFNAPTFTMPRFYLTVITFILGAVAVIVAAELQVRENRRQGSEQ